MLLRALLVARELSAVRGLCVRVAKRSALEVQAAPDTHLVAAQVVAAKASFYSSRNKRTARPHGVIPTWIPLDPHQQPMSWQHSPWLRSVHSA